MILSTSIIGVNNRQVQSIFFSLTKKRENKLIFVDELMKLFLTNVCLFTMSGSIMQSLIAVHQIKFFTPWCILKEI